MGKYVEIRKQSKFKKRLTGYIQKLKNRYENLIKNEKYLSVGIK